MIKTIVLDAGPVSKIVHPRKFRDIKIWFQSALASGRNAVLPEIIDYEVRRGLLRIPAAAQLERLDFLRKGIYFDPITRPIMHDAAHIWAKARNMGKPFTSDDRLDGDAILIAQIRALGDPEQLTVITENVKHLEPFVSAMRWQDFEV